MAVPDMHISRIEGGLVYKVGALFHHNNKNPQFISKF